jgi:hypothetical protein
VRILRDVIRISRGVLLAEHARLAGHGHRQRIPITTPPRWPTGRARLVLDREHLCALGPEVTAYVSAISQRRRRVLADELAAGLALEAHQGADVLRRAAAACVARDTCGAEYLLLFAGAQPGIRSSRSGATSRTENSPTFARLTSSRCAVPFAPASRAYVAGHR